MATSTQGPRGEPESSLVRPITDPREIDAFLKRLPIALDRERFCHVVLGFPRRYLEVTPAAEVVRHYALLHSLGAREVVSSIAGRAGSYRMCVVARDRSSLFARIAGTLSSFGLSVVSAEAFANANAMVLDTFSCADPEGRFEAPATRREFQVLLERVIRGGVEVGPLLERRLPGLRLPVGIAVRGEFDDTLHPAATRLALAAPDCLGLLYLVSRALADAGCNIELAEVTTPAGAACDVFYLTRGGAKLDAAAKQQVLDALAAL